MKTIITKTTYVFFKQAENTDYYYIRGLTESEDKQYQKHFWGYGYENSDGIVSFIGASLPKYFCDLLEKEYQSTTKA